MSQQIIKVLFFGDIVGPLGRKAVKKYLALHKEQDHIDFIIANGENTTHGRGLCYEHYKELLSYGIDAITSGNHYFNAPDAFTYAKQMDHQVRPYNLDVDAPGVGSRVFETKDGIKIRVTNLLGRVYMNEVQSNPFYDADKIIKEDEEEIIHIIDFHAEATAEKRVFAEYVSGRVTAVLGTHTHVQTNDAKLLAKGTYFCTDVGMNGAYYSSLGCDLEGPMHKTITGMPAKTEVARVGKMLCNATEMEIDVSTHRVVSFRLINETFEDDPS